MSETLQSLNPTLVYEGSVYEISTGRITRIVWTETEANLNLQPQEGEAILIGHYDTRTHYVVDGAVVARPDMPIPQSIEVNGTQTITVPEGAFVRHPGVKVGTINGESIDVAPPLNADGYEIVIRAFPYRDHVLTVNLPTLERAKRAAKGALHNAFETRVLKLKEGYHPFEQEGFAEKKVQARDVISGGDHLDADLLITELRFSGVAPTAANVLALANDIDTNARLVGKLPFVVAGIRKRAVVAIDSASSTQAITGALTRANNVFLQLETFFAAKDVAGFEAYINNMT